MPDLRDSMSKVLVAYFSASGVTGRVAEMVAEAAGADIARIEPAVPYSEKDLDWKDSSSRNVAEKDDESCRPKMKRPIDASGYDAVIIGYPVWWYIAPRIVQTFIEANGDLKGKKVAIFATSGGTRSEGTADILKDYYGLDLVGARTLNGATKADAKSFVGSLGL